MTHGPGADGLVGRIADERLLAEESASLPAGVGRPEVIPPSTVRGRLVGLGAALTGVTLITGMVLIGLGAIDALSGGLGLGGIIALVMGAILAGTHWGWVHVAEATADGIEARRQQAIVARRHQWLETIEPYTHYEVTTRVSDDGSIAIDRVEHRPVPSGERSFTFTCRTERVAVYSGEDAAAVAERAELVRQLAAADTEREHQRFRIAADAYQQAFFQESDDEQELAVRRAAAHALSRQINSHLNDPPIS